MCSPSVAEAAEFYLAFKRRHYVGPEQNPKGVQLAWDNLRMLQDLIPRAWRLVGLGVVPRIYMQDLIGLEGCARVQIPERTNASDNDGAITAARSAKLALMAA